MRIYLSGTTDIANTNILPSDIFFATEDCDETDRPSETCLMLSGIEVEAEYNDSNYGENITKEQILSIIKDKKMRLRNISDYLDFPDEGEVTVKVDYIKIVDVTGETEVSSDLLFEEMLFID